MKKLVYVVFLMSVMLMATVMVSKAQGNSNHYPNDNALIGKAIAAFRSQCPQNYTGEITGTVETVGVCFVSGYLKRVLLVPVLRCPGNQPCMYLPIRLSTVDFDCEGNVAAVNCN